MADFPTYQRQVSPQGALVAPQGPTMGEAVGAGLDKFGQGISQAATDFAQADQIDLQRQLQANRQSANRAFVDFTGQQSQAYRDAVKNAPPGAAGFADQVLANYDKANAATRQSIPASELDNWDTQSAELRNNIQVQAGQFQDASRDQFTADQFDGTVAAAAQNVAKDPTTYAANQKTLISSSAALDAPPQLKAALLKSGNQQLTIAMLNGRITLDPTAAKKAIASGQWDSTLGQQSKQALLSNADAAIKDQDYQQQKAQAEALQAQRQQAATKLSDLTIAIGRGTAGYQDVEQAYNGGKGWLDPADRANLTLMLDQRNQQNARQQAALDFAGGVLRGKADLDPTNRDQTAAMDAYYQNQVKSWTTPGYDPATGQTIPPKTPQQIGDLTLAFVNKAGVIPDSLAGQLRGQLRNGSADQMLGAADIIEQFRESNPALLEGFAPAELERASAIADQVRAGVAPQQAVGNVLDREKLDHATVEGRTQAYTDMTQPSLGQTRTAATASELQGAINTRWQRYMPLAANPAIPPEMAAQYDLLKKDAYIRTGDMDQAQKSAVGSLQRVWGQSSFNGSIAWMRTPPENFYSAPPRYHLTPEQNTAWMKDQLVQEFGKNAMFDTSAGPLEDRLTIVPTDRTNPDGSGRPLYAVIFRNSKGQPTAAMTTDPKSGKVVPMLWAPNWEKSTEKKTLDDAQAQEIDKLELQRKLLDQGVPGSLIGEMSQADMQTYLANHASQPPVAGDLGEPGQGGGQ